MDDQSRRNELPRSGIRNFMTDPKSSVMQYLAENMAAQQQQQQQQQQPHQSSGANGPSQTSWHQTGISSYLFNHHNVPQSNLSSSQISQNEGRLPSHASQPGMPQPGPNLQQPTIPYNASNVDLSVSRPPGGYIGIDQETVQEAHQQDLASQLEHRLGLGELNASSHLGKAPPAAGVTRKTSPHSAARLYSRMCVEFEASKTAFFKARAERNTREVTSAAYDLESLSRRIWNLRFEHASEFEGYQDSGHQAVMTHWQSQYELWADTVADIQDGELTASGQNAYSVGSGSMSTASAYNAIPPGQVNGSFQNVSPSVPQGMSGIPAAQAPMHEQRIPDPQNDSLGQNIPMTQNLQSYPPPQNMQGTPSPQNMQNNVPPQNLQSNLQPQSMQSTQRPQSTQSNLPPQNMPSTSMPGNLQSNNNVPLSSGQTLGQLPGAFPQQSMNPAPSQRPTGPNLPPPGVMGAGPQRPQNASPNPQPNNSQLGPQQVSPQGQRPPQQQPPQQMPAGRAPNRSASPLPNSGSQPNMQSSSYVNQQPGSRPPTNGNLPAPGGVMPSRTQM